MLPACRGFFFGTGDGIATGVNRLLADADSRFREGIPTPHEFVSPSALISTVIRQRGVCVPRIITGDELRHSSAGRPPQC